MNNTALQITLPHLPCVVGLSGGLDSIVLLHLAWQQSKLTKQPLSALHINHNLSPHAQDWADFCTAVCAAWQIPLQIISVHLQRKGGQSLEAIARQARYNAYQAHPADAVLLAHHQDDQAETLMLQLLRGGGIKGMAAMPAQRDWRGKQVLRPLLAYTRAQLHAYASAHSLQWVEDESNQDTRYQRNQWRQDFLPQLAHAYPQYRQTLSQTATWCAEATQLLEELAFLDNGGQMEQLSCHTLAHLPTHRGQNLLRAFIGQHTAHQATPKQFEQLWQQILHAKQDAQICIQLGTHDLRRYQQQLYLVPHRVKPKPYHFVWHGQTQEMIPDWGVLHVQPSPQVAQWLDGKTIHIQPRQGGETIRQHGQTQSIKKLLQASLIPPWERAHLPYIWVDGILLAVPPIAQADNITRQSCTFAWEAKKFDESTLTLESTDLHADCSPAQLGTTQAHHG